MLIKYEELNAIETNLILEEAITFIIQNENEITEALANIDVENGMKAFKGFL